MGVNRLAQVLAEGRVWDLICSDRWMGWPDDENPEQIQEAIEEYMPWAVETAERYKALLDEED